MIINSTQFPNGKEIGYPSIQCLRSAELFLLERAQKKGNENLKNKIPKRGHSYRRRCQRNQKEANRNWNAGKEPDTRHVWANGPACALQRPQAE